MHAAATALGKPLAAQVILPPARLLGPESIEDLLATIPRDGVTSYMLWTPQITEELLLGGTFQFHGSHARRNQCAQMIEHLTHDVATASHFFNLCR